MKTILSIIGYLLNSILAIIFIFLIIDIFTKKSGKKPENIPAGILAKDITEIINSWTKKIIPVDSENSLTITSIILVIAGFILIKIIFL